jgi:uncharacterized hydrophobic protein (TIGR00271 family)
VREIRQAIANFFRYRFNLDEDKANESEIIEALRKNVEFKGTNLWALIFAIFIASIGLNTNSTAIIIGAMLISPIMGPIMGVGLGAGIFDFSLINYSLKNLGIAVFISLITSALYFRLTPIQEAQSELIGRTSPTLWDVLIALFGGLAGIIASTRKNISNTIPGVAIATALMPPLCTAGYGLGTGNYYFFAGAFYLFVINSVFISLATFLMVRFLKFEPVEQVNRSMEKKVRTIIWIIAMLTILPSTFLAYRFVEQEIFKQNLHRFTRNEIESRNLYIINQKTKPLAKQASLLVYGDGNSDSNMILIKSRMQFYHLDSTKIAVKFTLNSFGRPDNAKQVGNISEPDEHTALLIQKDVKIKALEKEFRKKDSKDSVFYSEFSALFGPVQEISLVRIPIFLKGGAKTNCLLLYIRDKRRIPNSNRIEGWLKSRFNTDTAKVVIERK